MIDDDGHRVTAGGLDTDGRDGSSTATRARPPKVVTFGGVRRQYGPRECARPGRRNFRCASTYRLLNFGRLTVRNETSHLTVHRDSALCLRGGFVRMNFVNTFHALIIFTHSYMRVRAWKSWAINDVFRTTQIITVGRLAQLFPTDRSNKSSNL